MGHGVLYNSYYIGVHEWGAIYSTADHSRLVAADEAIHWFIQQMLCRTNLRHFHLVIPSLHPHSTLHAAHKSICNVSH